MKAWVFDCDGVLLETVRPKTEAFLQLFEEHPQHLPDLEAYQRRQGGLSRFHIFEWFYRQKLGIRLEPARAQELSRRYSELVRRRVAEAGLVPGCFETLQRLSGQPLFVASGAPQEELERALESHGLSRFFESIWGSPHLKAEVLRGVAARFREVVMIGDAWSDYEAAQAAGVDFVGRLLPGLDSPFPATVPTIKDLTELLS